MNEQNSTQMKDGTGCGPGCHCGATGGGARMKWIICGIVAVAAIGTVAVHISRAGAEETPSKQDYALPAPVAAAIDAEKSNPVAGAIDWGAPLQAMADLNKVATNTEAVFVVIPSADAARTAAIQKDVSTAAATLTGRGTKMGTFLLSPSSEEYTAVSKQIGAPAVLVMYKGRGMMTVADKDVSQEGLLQAFVGASRPSSCGPSGCGPASSGCP